MPELLNERQWDCSEAIELNKWTFIVEKRLGKLPSHCFGNLASESEMSLADVFISINELRHSAVHRLPTTVKGISEMVRSATSFAGALRDSGCQQQLEELHHELEGKICALELNKNFLETRVEHEIQEIARQRKKLDDQEREVVATMLREDKDYGSFIGILLSRSVNQIFDKSKNDEAEVAEVERSLDSESKEEKEQELVAEHDIDHVDLDIPFKANFGVNHDLKSENLELKSKYPSSLEAEQCVLLSPSTEDDGSHEMRITEREFGDPIPEEYNVPQEVHSTTIQQD